MVKIIEDIEKEENEEEDDLDIGQPTNQPISEVGTEIALPEIVDVKIPDKDKFKEEVTSTESPVAGIIQIQQNIIDSISGVPGIVLLNETDVSEIFDDPDTLIINGEDILIGPNGEVVLSTGLEGDQVVVDGLSGLSDQIQKAVEEAIREGLTGTTETEVVVVNLLGEWSGDEDEEKAAKEQLRQFVEETVD